MLETRERDGDIESEREKGEKYECGVSNALDFYLVL
jgi:hypothetical protein